MIQVACTGLHGANRLASTSLLEGVVWGVAVADYLKAEKGTRGALTTRIANVSPLIPLDNTGLAQPDDKLVKEMMAQIRRVMWEKVGVVRRKSGG